MSRFVRRISLLALALVAIAGVAYLVRNPEKTTLNAAARAGAPGKFVTLSDGVTHYDVSGPDTGRAVVLVHGASVPYYIWDSTAVALSNAGYRVIRYDRYGFGLSDRPDALYDSTMFTRQINDLADSLKLTQFDLMGLSLGGFVTAHYIASHADRVRTLTLLDPVAVGRAYPWYMKLPVVHEWFMQTLVVPAAADGQPGDFFHPEKFPGWADRFRPQTAYRGIGRAMYRTGIALEGADYPAMYKVVGKTGIPVLLVWGKQDPVIAYKYSDMLRAAIPQAEFLPVDSAGHLPGMERSALVNAKMLEFLSAHTGARP